MTPTQNTSFKNLSVEELPCKIPSWVNKEKLRFLDRGKRAIVFRYEKDTVLKIERNDIDATGRLQNEGNFLKILNKHNIGPKLIKAGKYFIYYEYVKGKLILNYIKEKKEHSLPILKKILQQCYTLDRLGINKLEMHKPVKHIFVQGKELRMIDFERCYYTKRPKNITQFIQFITSKQVQQFLKVNIEEIRRQTQEYKKHPSENNFKQILKQAEDRNKGKYAERSNLIKNNIT